MSYGMFNSLFICLIGSTSMHYLVFLGAQLSLTGIRHFSNVAIVCPINTKCGTLTQDENLKALLIQIFDFSPSKNWHSFEF